MDAETWNQRYAASDLVWSAGPNQFVESELAASDPGAAVDLAAGEGRNALWLAGRGWRVEAVDFARAGLDKGARVAAERGLDGVTWTCADATTWQPAAPVDLVVVAYLQLAPAQRARALRGGLAMLRPGGTLLVVAHDSANLAHGHGGPQDPRLLYTAEDVLADLDAGDPAYEVVRAARVERAVGTDEGERVALDALVRVTRV